MMTVDYQNCFSFILLCFFSLLCHSLFFKKLKDQQGGYDLPPSPPSLPIIGHLHHLLSSLAHKSLQKLSSKYGPLLYLSIFNFPVVLVSSASVAYEIFKAHDLNISSRDNPPIDESLLIGSSVFVGAPYGDYWKFMKKLLVTKILGTQALERSRGVREDELERFYTSLLDKATKKQSVEIGKEATKLIINSICRMSMGRSFSEENGEAERVRGLVTELDGLTKKVLLVNILRWPLEKLGISLFKKEIMYVSDSFGEVLERVLVEHEEKPDKHQGNDLMDVLLEAYGNENSEHKITRNHIKSLFVELFLGGTDTSAQTIQWTMAEIINDPNILTKLREEIDSVVGKTRLIQETDLPKLPYLESVVKEGLRLHPPLPLVVRTLQRSGEIKGFYVPEKTTLVVNAYAVMRDPSSWEDPDEFKPERFLGKKGDERKALKHIAFGSGRRGCPGSNLASIFIGTVIGTMVQCFDWRIIGDKVKMDEAGGINLTMAYPLKLTPIPRIEPSFSNLQIPNSSSP
ncbi:LOW QUALITY PROTEIN: cytochrome P450 705A20 [Capsella rubella]|uniref:LOW QUALITY PROTEIN: cytochrome P450 705A20 n=1 Tax=Capsella rubella TaxID=81985 RepID=UPI000CD4E96C|nr:LOW QUALITY PROTEIN: cytochrome P450 705A20 [Capsella rubella]